jgi:hypothetical protein
VNHFLRGQAGFSQLMQFLENTKFDTRLRELMVMRIGSVTGSAALSQTSGSSEGGWAGYHETWFSFRIVAIAFRPRSFSTRSGFISASP